jgi:hypothetical protein
MRKGSKSANTESMRVSQIILMTNGSDYYTESQQGEVKN